jgi:hypothetical protein
MIELSEENLEEILKLTRKHPVFGYEIVETLSKDLLKLTRICKDVVKFQNDNESLSVYIIRLEHAMSKSNADV